MNIRYKLSIQFTLIVVTLLFLLTTGIFYFSSSFRKMDFYKRLKDRANTTAQLLLNVEEVNQSLLKIIDKNSLALLQEEIYMIDSNNNQIYSNVEGSIYYNLYVLDKIRKDKKYEFTHNDKDAIGIIYSDGNHEYVVIASAYDAYGINNLANLKIILFAGFLFGLTITIVAGLIFSGKALAPISTVVSQVKNISITNLNLRVDEGNKKDEIAQLAITFNQMLQRLEEAFILQRDFVSNAAHELRTPFTVLLAEIDYCLMQEREKKQYISTLIDLSQELKKLSKLSNGLLYLARMSYDNSNYEMKTIRMDEIIVETCNDILSNNSDFKINIDFEGLPENDDLLKILGNEQLLKIAIKNLVENACKFSGNKTSHINFLVDEKSLTIHFRDEGIGIPEDNINNIFQPFYRGNNTQFIAGYGLGLALALKVIQLHNGYIYVKSKVGVGSEFTVNLPNRLSFNQTII
jgi:signal transduction histidine kinase